MSLAIFQAADLNQIRGDLYTSASLTFYKVTPSAGETQIATLTSGWVSWRKNRKLISEVGGAVTIAIAYSTGVDINALRENAAVDLTINSQIKRYRVAEITETQQLGAGWILHCEPMSNTV
jgi:hypothetical protein